MARKYDIEEFITELEDVVKNNLSAKLSEITTDKGDSLALDDIPSSAIMYELQADTVNNFKASLYIGITNVQTDSAMAAIAETYSVELVVILPESYDNNINKRLFRYQRALKEIILENFKSVSRIKQEVEVSSLAPISFQIQNSDHGHKAIGIEVQTVIYN